MKPISPPPPQKNSDFSKDADVMALVQRQSKGAVQKDIKPKADAQAVKEKAKNDLRRIILQVKIDPKRIVAAGKMAERAMKDKKMYPFAIQKAIADNLISSKDVQPGVIDYSLLAKGMTAGRLTEELIKEGKV
jgi:hypothetical protein